MSMTFRLAKLMLGSAASRLRMASVMSASKVSATRLPIRGPLSMTGGMVPGRVAPGNTPAVERRDGDADGSALGAEAEAIGSAVALSVVVGDGTGVGGTVSCGVAQSERAN